MRTYLNNINNKMYATVYFTQKEEADGYQYIQILADDSTNYDQNDTWGEVYDPSISIYKACFEMSYTGDYSADEHYQFFPHRYDYVNKEAEIAAGLSNYSFDYDNSYLYEQKYQSSAYDAPNTGSLNLATTVNDLNIRFDAGGNSTDDWDFKDLKVRLALVDNTAPTVLDNYQVSGGPHCKGNIIYVSVPFSEIVENWNYGDTVHLYTTWGTLKYASGSGTNVFTFRGTISNNASGTFAVNRHDGMIMDLAGNFLSGSISHNFGISLDSLYSITYDLAGGTLPEGQSNPETYTKMTATFTLNNPTRPGYAFTGWTGSNGDTPQTVVTIEQGSEGDRSYTANWEPNPFHYTFDSETGALELLWGEFNMFNKWGYDLDAASVKSVTATDEVSFIDDCSGLFYNFTNCESIDLSKVNTSGMTNAAHLFSNCESLTSLDLSDWNTDSVTSMSFMFNNCKGLTSLDLSSWNTANVDDMTRMFNGCESLTSLDLSHWNTDSVTSMNYMFSFCPSLTSLDISSFNTANVTDMGAMFGGCESLTSLDVSRFNTANVTDMSYMFVSCSGLTTLDLSSFNTGNVTDMTAMFAVCSNLTTIYASEFWSTEKVTESIWMFTDCINLVGGMGTTYDENFTDTTYAHIDGGPDNPGYFTAKPTFLRGDVNGDDKVSISDVTALINYLLSHNTTGVNVDAADCNQDSKVNISDVTALINYLLSHSW